MTKRMIAGLLTVLMLLGCVPMTAYAAEEPVYLLPPLTAKKDFVRQTTYILEEAVDVDAFRAHLADGMRRCEESIDISAFEIRYSEEMWKAVGSFIFYEMPECFHVTTFGGSLKGMVISSVNPKYSMDAETYAQTKAECDAAAEKLLRDIPADSSMGEAEKALLLHDRLAVWCEYDTSLSLENTHSMVGALRDGVAVCQGYAMAYSYLLRQVGMKSRYCGSDLMSHGWNIVTVDGVDYHVDVTWDDPVSDVTGRVNHDNFLLSSEGIKATGHSSGGVVDYDTRPTDARYEQGVWKSSQTEFQLLEGEIYYINNEEAVLARYGREEALLSVADEWLAAGGGVWPGNYARLSGDGRVLLYSLSDGVYSYDPKSAVNESVAKADLSVGEGFAVYGFTYRDGYALCDRNASPNFAGNTKDLYRETIYVHRCEFDREVAEEAYLAEEADCLQGALYFKSCLCGAAGEETFLAGEALGHKGSAWEKDENSHWFVCERCGEERAEEKEHEFDSSSDPNCHLCGFVRKVSVGSGADGRLEWIADTVNPAVGEQFCVVLRAEVLTSAVGSVDLDLALSEGLELVSYEILVDPADFMLFDFDPEALHFGCGLTATGKSESFDLLRLTLRAKNAGAGVNTLYLSVGAVTDLGGETALDYAAEPLTVITQPYHDECSYDRRVVSAVYCKSKATCTESAVYYKSCECSDRGEETFSVGDPLGHSMAWVKNEEGHQSVCGNCLMVQETQEHRYTDEEDISCNVCGYIRVVQEGQGEDGCLLLRAEKTEVNTGEDFEVLFSAQSNVLVGSIDFLVILSENLQIVSHEILVDPSVFLLSNFNEEEGHFGCGMTMTGKDGGFDLLKLTLRATADGEHSVSLVLDGQMGNVYDLTATRILKFGSGASLGIRSVTPHECVFDREVISETTLASEATCTEAERYYKLCQCGKHAEETFSVGEALGHRFTEKQYDEKKHWLVCERCSATEGEEAHSFDHACDPDCNGCDFEREITHDTDGWEKDEEKHWRICSLCRERIDEGEHRYADGKDASCEDCGYCRYESYFHWVYRDNGDGTVTLVDYCGAGGVVTVPSRIRNQSVTALGDGLLAELDCLEEVKLPQSVLSVGEAALGGESVPCVYYEGTEEAWAQIAFEEEEEKAALAEKLFVSQAVGSSLVGDANGDSNLNFSDIQRIYQHLSSGNKMAEESLLSSDANGDGAVSFSDIQRIYQHLSGGNKLF